jgi:hypothetical protein
VYLQVESAAGGREISAQFPDTPEG